MFLRKFPALERRHPAAIAAGLGALALIYAGYWLFLAHLLKQGFADFKDSQRRNGVQIAAQSVATRGFPGPVALTLAAPFAQKATTPLLRWSAQGLAVALNPLQPLSGTIASLGGPQQLLLRDESAKITLEVASEALAGDIRLRELGGALDYAVLKLAAVTGRLRAGAAAQADAFGAGRIETVIRPGRLGPSADKRKETVFALTGEDLTLPERFGYGLGTAVSFASIDAQLTGGAGGPFDLDAFARDGVEALRIFFEGDGRLDISRLALRWGALDATARGALGLDAQHRLSGNLMVEAAGYRDALMALAKDGRIEEKDAAAIAGALDVLAALRRDPLGRVAVLLVAQNGKLFVGPIEAAALEPLF